MSEIVRLSAMTKRPVIEDWIRSLFNAAVLAATHQPEPPAAAAHVIRLGMDRLRDYGFVDDFLMTWKMGPNGNSFLVGVMATIKNEEFRFGQIGLIPKKTASTIYIETSTENENGILN